MDLEYFRNFIMIVDSHTLTEAARRLNVVQPALSAQLKHIETYYDADLIRTQRGGRRISLTEEGKLFYDRAKHILAIADGLEREIADCVSGASGILRISLMPAMVSSFVTGYMKPFCEKNPDIEYEFDEGNAEEQGKALTLGLTEIGFIQTPLAQSYDFNILSSQKQGIDLIVRKDNPWLSDTLQHVRIKNLTGVPLCITRRFVPIVNRIAQDSQIHLVEKVICETKGLAMTWVKEGLGAAIVCGEAAEIADPDLMVIPLREKSMSNTEVIYVLKDRQLSNAAHKFLDFFQIPEPALSKK